jgi:putative ABC transport system permease protein
MMRLSLLWLSGLCLNRYGRLVGGSLGVAFTVALIAVLLGFIDGASRSMTARAIAGVPVDWQVELSRGADPARVISAIERSGPSTVIMPVGYAEVASFVAKTGDTVQTTGAGKALGLPEGYGATLPGQMRLLLGSLSGPLLAQQTAANLHATVGDWVTLSRPGLAPADLIIAGIVDLPNQDSIFQAIGVPPGAAPQAPPDNVVLVPEAQWHTLFDPQAQVRPDSVRTQLHVRLARADLPRDPASAYAQVVGRTRNVEARVAGSGIIANNLAARLEAVRSDSLYARLLFLFLGAPGLAVAILLTLAVTGAGEERRRREQALLRARGATSGLLMLLSALEAATVAGVGIAAGLGLAFSAALALPDSEPLALAPALVAASSGLLLALAGTLIPAWRSAKGLTIVAARRFVLEASTPLWQRSWLDAVLLAIGGAVFWYEAASGYQLVLALEGVAQVSVDNMALLAPLCLWLGIALLCLRLIRALLARAPRLAALGPRARLSSLRATLLRRRRMTLARGVALAALAVGFAVSTSVFNTTYEAQSEVDAALTNGADVTVTGSPGHPAGERLDRLRALPGLAAAEPMQHRFAYVGSDLQDLYGIDPASISQATPMADAYFGDGDAKSTLARLAATPDGVLVSDETVSDFQLQLGDTLNLRLQNAGDHQYHVVPFRFIGIAREFPTAPRDSFLVANANYVAEATTDARADLVLLRARSDPELLAGSARAAVADLPGVRVTSLGETQRVISSSLTAVDLRGLTRLELFFALAGVIGVTGLLFGLDISERRRGFAVLALIGASGREIAAFLWSEAILVVACGLLMGALSGLGIAYVLVKELQGVFDPPPEALSLPIGYLVTLVASAIVAASAVVLAAARHLQVRRVDALKEI